MYKKSFEIRWSDLDANRHVANSSYPNFLSETRLSYLRENGFFQRDFARLGFGPIIFSEEFFYIKEIQPNETITATLELLAHSPNAKFMKFAHCIFNEDEKLSLYSETFVGWLDLNKRKLIIPPDKVADIFLSLTKADSFHLLPDDLNLKNPKIPFGKTLNPQSA